MTTAKFRETAATTFVHQRRAVPHIIRIDLDSTLKDWKYSDTRRIYAHGACYLWLNSGNNGGGSTYLSSANDISVNILYEVQTC